MSLKRKIPPSSGAVLTEAVARQLLLHAIRTVPRADFRAWLENRENFRLRRFDMPKMGVCWVNYSGLTCAAGLGLWVDGFVQDDVGVWPAFGKHGFADCSLCRGAPHNEFSFGSNDNTHTFCFRCVVEHGDDTHVLENLLFLANHQIKDRANATWSRDKRCRAMGKVPLVRIKQTSPCHREFFINYGTKDATTALRTDTKICVGHPGGPRVLGSSVGKPNLFMCLPCHKRFMREQHACWGVCPFCKGCQTGGDPVCGSCVKAFAAFVLQRTPAVLPVVHELESDE